MKAKQPKRIKLDAKGSLWYNELKALNYPISQAEEREYQKWAAPRKYRERLPYVMLKGGRKVLRPEPYELL